MDQHQTAATTQATQRLTPVPTLLGMEFVRGMPPGHMVVFTQTEDDMKLIHKLIHPAAVTYPPGQLWDPRCANQLLHYDLILFTRNDPYSLARAETIARDCYSKCAKVRILPIFGCPPYLGVGGWIQTGGDRPRLFAQIQQTPIWRPSDASPGSETESESPGDLDVSASEITRAVSSIVASIDELEAVVALNRILDAVRCPGPVRAYPLAVISAFYDLFKNGEPLDQFSSSATHIGSYLPGSKPKQIGAKKALQMRALRAETAFNEWQRSSGYTLISREPGALPPITDASPIHRRKSLYRIPLIKIWCEVLITARQRPAWRQGRRKRAQAIRRAARRIIASIFVAPDPSALNQKAPPAHQVNTAVNIARIHRSVPATIKKGFHLVSDNRLQALPSQLDNELAGQIVRDTADLAEIALNAIWEQFNQIITACIDEHNPDAPSHTPASALDLWNRILKPYTTPRIVVS